jgi:hypothetical protein
MSLVDNGNNMVMPVSPMCGYGNGMGDMFGNNGWWIILFFFALFGGGWGNGAGFGGNNGSLNTIYPYLLNNQTQNEVVRGFDNAGVTGQLSAIQNAITTGFSSAEVANCNRELNSITNMNNLAMALQNCCCENRAGLADLKYTVATEACADRAAVNDALRDVIAANTASTQKILDQMCQDKIDAKNEKIAELQQQLTMANLAASQTAQTAQLLADNNRQTAVLEDYLNPVARPAYIVQNPNCCQQMTGCGCGNF